MLEIITELDNKIETSIAYKDVRGVQDKSRCIHQSNVVVLREPDNKELVFNEADFPMVISEIKSKITNQGGSVKVYGTLNDGMKPGDAGTGLLYLN